MLSLPKISKNALGIKNICSHIQPVFYITQTSNIQVAIELALKNHEYNEFTQITNKFISDFLFPNCYLELRTI